MRASRGAVKCWLVPLLVALILALHIYARASDQLVVTLRNSSVPAGTTAGATIQKATTRLKHLRPAFRPKNKALAARFGLDRVFIADQVSAKDLSEIRKDPSVESARTSGSVHLALVPNDPKFTSQWHLRNTGQGGGTIGADIHAVQAWNTTTGLASINVAVIDTGVDLQHPDLQANIWTNPNEIPGNLVDDDDDGYVDDVNGWNFTAVNTETPYGNNNPQDDHGHGTSCGGIVAAVGNNGIGVCGVSWSSKIMPVKVVDANGNGDDLWVAQGIIYAADAGADVISVSLVLDTDVQVVHNAVLYAINSGVTVVAAMGNDSSSQIRFPAAIPEVIAVGSTDRNDTHAWFSDYGNHIDVAAPGVNIVTTALGSPGVPGGTTDFFTGTSASTPMVAGMCAVVLSVNNTIMPDQMQNLIRQGADDLPPYGFDTKTGYGRANLYATLLALQDSSPPSVPSVSVAGPYTYSDSSITFSWTASSDAESGIAGYEYAIGTAADPLSVRSWTPIGLVTEYTAPGLLLQPGQAYQISVRAKNGAHLLSAAGVSPPVIYAPPADSIGAVREMGYHTYVTLQARRVTASFPGRTWISEVDRSSSIAVEGSFGAGEGDVVTVSGWVDNTECYVTLRDAVVEVLSPADPLRPAYRLQRVLSPDFTYPTEVKDGIARVRLSRIRLATNSNTFPVLAFDLKFRTSVTRTQWLDIIHHDIAAHGLRLNQVVVQQATFQLIFLKNGMARSKSMTFSVTIPSLCNLKTKRDEDRQIGERCLRLWEMVDA